MDYHDVLKVAGGLLALALFVPLLLGVWRDGGVGQSFATWLLWAALDTTATITLWQQHGNYPLVLGFAIGGILMALALLYKGRFGWRRFDTGILLLVLLCQAVWWQGGPKFGTIAATLGVCVAGIPGFLELWRQPNRHLGHIWAWYALANGLAFWGGRGMTVPERFAPGVFVVQSLLMVAAGWRRAPENVTCTAKQTH